MPRFPKYIAEVSSNHDQDLSRIIEFIDASADIGCDALGVDWSIDLETARKYVKDKVALQGNLNPKTLLDSPENIRQGVLDTLTSYGKGPGHVFNLGHGITPDVNPDNLAVLVKAVHEFSPSFHD